MGTLYVNELESAFVRRHDEPAPRIRVTRAGLALDFEEVKDMTVGDLSKCVVNIGDNRLHFIVEPTPPPSKIFVVSPYFDAPALATHHYSSDSSAYSLLNDRYMFAQFMGRNIPRKKVNSLTENPDAPDRIRTCDPRVRTPMLYPG